MRAADAGEILGGPGHLQGGEVEELDRGNILVDGFRRELTLVKEVKLVLSDGLQIEQFGALAEVLGETRHVVNIVSLGFGREVAQLHVFEHAFS